MKSAESGISLLYSALSKPTLAKKILPRHLLMGSHSVGGFADFEGSGGETLA
ncbi:MAG: hypothetical protein V7K90_15090 [Nostoc sp.]|uniref:hypothetical protein n=1 Tax=Nostoc sp. TaxID=1180 RepID=UPI002FF9832A